MIFGSVTGMKKSLSSIALRADKQKTIQYVCIIYPPLPTLYSYRKGRKPVYSLYSDGERGGYMIHNVTFRHTPCTLTLSYLVNFNNSPVSILSYEKSIALGSGEHLISRLARV